MNEIKREQVSRFILIVLGCVVLLCVFSGISILTTLFAGLFAMFIGLFPICLFFLFLWFCNKLWIGGQAAIKKRPQEEIKKRQQAWEAEQGKRERRAEEQRQRERQQREQEDRNRNQERERRDRGATQREAPNRTPYEILGVSPYATAEEIRRAYKKKALENHPDRTAGLGEEYRHLAEKRMKEINGAYEALKNK